MQQHARRKDKDQKNMSSICELDRKKMQLVFEKVLIYSVIQKDGLNFVSLYFKIRTSDKYDDMVIPKVFLVGR